MALTTTGDKRGELVRKLAAENLGGDLALAATLVGPEGASVGTPSAPLPVEISLKDTLGDAFGRLRISGPVTIFDSKQLFDNAPLFWDESLESGASISAAHSSDEAATTITSTLNTAGKFTRQTFMCFNYQPGKSQVVEMTGNLDLSGGGIGVQRRIGQFDNNNGLYFEDDEGTIKVVLRSKVSGVVVETKVAQAAWNLDVMDGNGASGVTLDWTKSQIFIIDYEWLAVGRVRYGVVLDGEIIYVHKLINANANAGAYMSTPNLPLRYQMITTGSSPASSMLCLCATVISEGGTNNMGLARRASTSGVALSASTANQLYALIGIRLKASHIGAVVKQEMVSALSVGNDDFEWILILNPTVAGTFTYVGEVDGAVEIALGVTANTVSGGIEMEGTFDSNLSGAVIPLDNARYLGAAIDGTPDEMVVCIRPLSTNATIQGSLTWREAP